MVHSLHKLNVVKMIPSMRTAPEVFPNIKRTLFRNCLLSEYQSRNARSGVTSIRCLASKGTTYDESEPFFGKPRQAVTTPGRSVVDSFSGRLAMAVLHATTAFSDPTRADAVAALGEITGTITLRRIHDKMMSDPTGRLILQERPIVSKANIPYDKLIAEAPDDIDDAGDDITFGQAYGAFLKVHGFDPDERDEVNFIEDETLAYIMLRYRQNHDFFHALTGLPPTVLGELGLKWLELFQTGLPIAALSCTVGSLRLNDEERQILYGSYLPWSWGCQSSSCFLMNVYYEKEFNTPIGELRKRLNLVPAPILHK